MRIISGKYKGRIITPPRNFKARPTTDRARESLFNILNNEFDFESLAILDLFSGTGSIGFEFHSRGAEYVEMVEKNYVHFQHLQNVKHEFHMENVRIIKGDVFLYLRKEHREFDLVFADPPFDLKEFAQVPELVLAAGLLKKNGLFILEHPSIHVFTAHPHFAQHRKYGGVNFTLFTKSSY